MAQNKEQTRESIISHLETLQSFGVKRVMRGGGVQKGRVNAMDHMDKMDPSTRPPTVDLLRAGSIDLMDKSGKLEEVQSLEELRAHMGDCTRCKLCKQRKNLVFGVGNPKATLMFAGEGPGADEDEQGIPFVGRAGQLLTKIIEAMGFKRDDVYIANVVKCRPPENRNPEPDEIAMCMPFLKQQIKIIKPKVVVCLGKFAAQTILETEIPISKLRGNFREIDGTAVMPTFHPAYLLRNPNMKRPMWEDCKKVMEKLKELNV